MKFLRLPSSTNGVVESWVQGKGREVILLYPGDALLSESVSVPPGVKGKKHIRQWMQANPEVCQWDPEKEKLLFLHHDGEYCHYWAVSHSLWMHWRSFMHNYRFIRVLPEWMLLPPPARGGISALRSDDTVLFRHSQWCGGALPASMATLLIPLNPRWFCLSTKGEGYPLSLMYCRQQGKTYGRCQLLWSGLRLSKTVLPALLSMSLAFCVAQTAEYVWLISTRISPDTIAKPELPVIRHHSAFSRAMALLSDIQQQGPVRMEDMSLHSHEVQFTLTTELTCPALKERLKPFTVDAQFRQHGGLCRIKMKGKV